jgi:hypothetical protein
MASRLRVSRRQASRHRPREVRRGTATSFPITGRSVPVVVEMGERLVVATRS